MYTFPSPEKFVLVNGASPVKNAPTVQEGSDASVRITVQTYYSLF